MSIVSHPANNAYRSGWDETFTKTEPTPSRRDSPRRNHTNLWTPAEWAIQDAVRAVENIGAHPLLTEAVILLGQAKDKVADFVDR